MGGSGAPISVRESASGMRDLMENLTDKDHGRFYTWDRKEHPW